MNIENDFQFKQNDVIVVGCSSGPDSMALVDMLLKIRDKYNLMLVIAHVNHNVREESLEEEKYIFDYCLQKSLMFETMTVDEYGEDNFENEARNIRYNFFNSLVEKYKANYLMTAHHGDDLIETIMMRIVRGSNLIGYSGFKKIVDMGSYKIVRPLINYTKEELEKYNCENDVKYYIDSSNSNLSYTRNRYRSKVLPFLKEEDKNVHLKFLKYSNTLNEASKFIIKERDRALKDVFIDKKIDISKFIGVDSYIQRECLYYIVSEFYQDDLILISDKHIDLIFDLIYSRKANSIINLPNEVVAVKTYNVLELKRVTAAITSYEVEFNGYVELPNGSFIKRIDDSVGNSNNICRLSSKELTLPLIVRTRKDGDRMIVKGLNGKKKIKDIFIDKKIGLSLRDSWPIVVDSSGNVVWIPGVKKSKFDKKKTENYDIILEYS